MMSRNKTNTANCVTEKVQKTRKEIEDLKLELQKLISNGINETKKLDETKLKVAESQRIKTSDANLKSPEVKRTSTSRSRSLSRIDTIAQKRNPCSSTDNKNVSPQKVRNYDREEAREYIKKQRERRSLERKVGKTENITHEDTKQKLKELQRKSLELVTKNVQLKRERSKSREKLPEKPVEKHESNKKHAEIKNQLVPDLIKAHSKDGKKDLIKPNLNQGQAAVKAKKPPCHPHITCRKLLKVSKEAPLVDQSTYRVDDAKNKAAIKIQAAFKGYRQRNAYKSTLNTIAELKRAEEEVAVTPRQDEKQVRKEIRSIPEWFYCNSTPSNPYNFANTVKRKLNLGLKEYSHVGVQSSLKEDQSKLLLKTKEDIKELLEKSAKSPIKSFVSHKHFEGIKLKDPVVLDAGKLSDSDTSKNIPDITSESNASAKPLKSINVKSNSSRIEEEITNHSKGSSSSSSSIRSRKEAEVLSEKSRKSPSLTDNSILASNKCSFSNSHRSSSTNSSSSEALKSFVNYMNDYNKTPMLPAFPKGGSSYSLPTSTLRTGTAEKSAAVHKSSPSVSVSMSTTTSTKTVSTETVRNTNNFSQRYSSTFTSGASSSVPSLVPPSVTLRAAQSFQSGPRTVQLRNGERTALESMKGNTNEIHLKFEAELHLLNDFNESLRQFMAVDKSLVELQNKGSNEIILQTKDTQTSFASKSLSNAPTDVKTDLSSRNGKTIENMTSIIESSLSRDANAGSKRSLMNNNTSSTIGLELSTFDRHDLSEDSTKDKHISLLSNFDESSASLNISRPIHEAAYANLSLDVFEQFIKEEDARLENFKTILRIREKSLLDRTKGELAWLEIQKKHLRETGQLSEVSLVKKKQRGLLIKLQHERHEMLRLKQMQKAASKERKTILKEQRNLIKRQLSTNNLVTKIKKIKRPAQQRDERRQSGPIKVYNLQAQTVTSETSISRQNSEEVISITSCAQSLAITSDGHQSDLEDERREDGNASALTRNSEHVKRTLLMREVALQRRRKAAEELLKWHQRLVEEEKKIYELEMAANSVINHLSTGSLQQEGSDSGHRSANGDQPLTILWQNMATSAGGAERNFRDEQLPSLGDLERPSRSAIVDKDEADRPKTELHKTKSKAAKYESQSNKTLLNANEARLQSSNTQLESSKTKLESNKTKLESSKKTQSESKKSKLESNLAHLELSRSNLEWSKIRLESNKTQLETNKTKLELNNTKLESNKAKLGSNKTQLESNKTKLESNKIKLESNQSQLELNKSQLKSKKYESESSKSELESSKDDSIKTEPDDKSDSESINTDLKLNSVSTPIESNSSSSQSTSISTKPQTLETVQESAVKESEISENVEAVRTNSALSSVINSEIIDKSTDVNSSAIESDIGTGKESNSIVWKSPVSYSSDFTTGNDDKNMSVECAITSLNQIKENMTSISNDISELQELSTPKSSDESVKTASQISLVDKSTVQNHSMIEELPGIDSSSSISKKSEEVVKTVNQDENSSSVKSESRISNGDIENTPDEILSKLESEISEFQRSLSKYLEVDTEDQNREESPSTNSIQNNDKYSLSQAVNEALEVAKTSSNDSNIENENHEDTQEDLETSKLLSSDAKTAIGSNEIPSQKSDSAKIDTSYENVSMTSSKLEEAFKSDDEDDFKSDSRLDEKSNEFVNDKTYVNELKEEEQQSEVSSEKLDESEHVHSNKYVTIVEKQEAEESEKAQSEALNLGLISPPINSYKEQSQSAEVVPENKSSASENTSRNSINSIDVDYEETSTPISGDNRKSAFVGAKTKLDPEVAGDNSDSKASDTSLKNSALEAQSQEVLNSAEKEELLSSTSEAKSESLNLSYGLVAKDKSDSSSKEQSLSELRVDVKKRVSEILADTGSSYRNENSPRLQDLYCTTYDLNSPDRSPESDSPIDPMNKEILSAKFGDEAEQLLKKQLAIEQEIKQLEQQQKEQIPYLYVREIPNKPPPPYTPPSSQQVSVPPSILPSSPSQVEAIVEHISTILSQAHASNELESAHSSEDGFKQILDIDISVSKTCYELLFDLSKELALEHYSQFEEDDSPSWLKLKIVDYPFVRRRLDGSDLRSHLNSRIKQILGFEKLDSKQKSLTKWCHKKRDHVDELLIMESQAEESQWTNYDYDELIVKNDLAGDIMNILLAETADAMRDVLVKKSKAAGYC